MDNVHPVTAVLTLAAIVLTAEWFVRREESLAHRFLVAIGG